MYLIRKKKFKRTITAILVVFVMISTCLRTVKADENPEIGGSEGICFHDEQSTWEFVNQTDANCTQEGYTGDWVCKVCGMVMQYGTFVPINNNNHDWDEGKVEKEMTCTQDGEILYTCKNNFAHTRIEYETSEGHDYQLDKYEAPTTKKDGYEIHKCTRCGDEYEETIPKLNGDDDIVFDYEDTSGATSDHISFYVGYFGMEFVEKVTLSLDEIMNGCELITQKYSYLNKRPSVCYDVATGVEFYELLDFAEISLGNADRFLFATADSGGNYYDASEITASNLLSTRYFFPHLSEYFMEDGTFSDEYEAWQGAEIVTPMLAIWDSWASYGCGQEFIESSHASNMKSGNCFRLLYGQSQINEASAITSAKWINTIYIRYSGTPTVDAGDDLDLTISSDYTVSANVSVVDEAMKEVFKNAVRWSSSDESVVKVDAKTGKLTTVGEGTAEITATVKVDGMEAVYDTITVSISADADEDLDGGGAGSGTGNGEGSGIGDGEGLGTGTGAGDGIGNGEQQNGSGNESGNASGNDSENKADNETGNAITDGNENTSKDEYKNDSTDNVIDYEKSEDNTNAETIKETSDQITNENLQKIVLKAEEKEISEKLQLKMEETVAEEHGKTIKAIALNIGDSTSSEGENGGQAGGGASGNVVLTLEEDILWFWTALFAIGMFVFGGAMMYRRYKREF